MFKIKHALFFKKDVFVIKEFNLIDKDKMLRVGVISNTHGIHGEVKVYPTTEDIKRFDFLKQVFLDTGKELKELEVTGVKYFKNLAILKFKGIDSINDVERWKQMDLLVTRENAIPLEEGEYYIYDLIGLDVYDENDPETPVGVLTEILQTSANDVYLVKTKDKKEILIPSIKDSNIRVSLEEKKITVHILPGLTD
ncbi:MAG: ribosome maturation factor RimM [Lachnospiraceae bacterium]|nr:ribosome maturation factor RimM [Lachnospiraceae bacterium]